MRTLNDIMELLTGPAILDDLADLLREKDPGFPEAEQKYLAASAYLKKKLADTVEPSLADFLKACQTEVIAHILYAAYQGYRANLENFHSPCQTSFYKTDFTQYIRDHLIGNCPINYEATRTQEAFSKALPKEYESAVSDIEDYFDYLFVAGPKLAHYAGYVIANKFLPWVEPGYREDYNQTICYQYELEKYMSYLPL